MGKRITAAIPITLVMLSAANAPVHATPTIPTQSIQDNRSEYSNSKIPRYEKLQISFQIEGTTADNYFFPYDPSPPPGIDPNYPLHQGVSVDAVFTAPDGNTYQQPAFFYQDYLNQIKLKGGTDREWYYPNGNSMWQVRFSPHQTGTWQYHLIVQDSQGTGNSDPIEFEVVNSPNPGFIKVSSGDTRYFEFDDGSLFTGLGFQSGSNLADPVLNNEPNFSKYQEYGINFTRNWQSSHFGSAWLEWLGGRNIYDGYLPRAGILPVQDVTDPNNPYFVLTQRLDYMEDSNGEETGWFDACRFQFWDDPEGVKQNTDYRIRVKYRAANISGPRTTDVHTNYGVVAKLGNWDNDCYNPSKPDDPNWSKSQPVTNYGGNTLDWAYIEGVWNSSDNDWLPRLNISLENVNATTPKPTADILSIEVQEILSANEYGPNIIAEPSLQYHLYVPQHYAYALDKAIELAEQYGIYMKMVIMEKNDRIYFKLDDDGTFVGEYPLGELSSESDNQDGFYGLGRGVNKTRWLQQAWWRYAQARWGYSPAIHSWEAANEGDPFNVTHWQLTDEMGKFFHCRVFGVPMADGDAQECTFDHPNDHLVTTSFWHSFPGYSQNTDSGFWGSPDYPNVDYADLHAYIGTGYAPCQDKYAMQFDAAYYHTWYSQHMISWKLGLPTVRGEAGLNAFEEDPSGNCTITALDGTTKTGRFVQSKSNLGIHQDTQGVWVHNYVWSQLDFGGMYDLYWWVNDHMQPEGYDNRDQFKPFHLFIKDIDLNKGDYWNSSATADNPKLRVIGQKDGYQKQTGTWNTSQNAHIWVQNTHHTWRNVVCSTLTPESPYYSQYECSHPDTTLTTESGTITLTGFEPHKIYRLNTWDTWDTQSNTGTFTAGNVQASATGDIIIQVTDLQRDVAYQIIEPTTLNSDLDSDGDTDAIDYQILINDYPGTSTVFEVNHLINQFGTTQIQ